MSYSIATIFLFNVVAVLTFPTVGHLLDMSPHAFGVWAGTAVNDTSSVVAAASVFGHGAVKDAVVVKLTRTLMIIPITFALALWRTRGAALDTGRPSVLHHVHRAFPTFIVWFLAATAVDSLGLIPTGWHTALDDAAQFMITMALAAIGLSTSVPGIRRAGWRPLALGAALWMLVGTTSIGLQTLTGTIR